MSWPLSQDYNEAIQSPASNFSDPDLKRGEAVANALGLPAPYSGNFADVYQVRCPDGSRWAVKCFTREAAGLRERYQEISAHLKQARLPFTVDFSYLDQGIRVAGKWYPVLKMQWVEGLTLNQFVGQYLDKPAMLEALLQLWARMGKYLRAAEVGHCDLQHGNVLLVPGATPNSLALKLIDYDGMWVPALAGKASGEVGHANYQHPRRLREGTFSLEVDRFPLLLVATAMRALKADKTLWAKYDNGDNMLFKESDLAAPGRSELFEELSSLPDPGLVMLAAQVRAALKGSLESAALLDDVMPEAKAAPASAKLPRPAAAPPSGVTKRKSVLVASPVAVAPAVSAPAADALAFEAADASAPLSFVRKKKRGKEKPAGVLSRLPLAAWIGGGAALAVVAIGGILVAVLALGGKSNPPVPVPPDNRVAQKDAVAPVPPIPPARHKDADAPPLPPPPNVPAPPPPAAIVPDPAPVGPAVTPTALSFETGWDKPVDPDGDCKFTPDKTALTIEAPGKRHDLSFGMNAPRMFRNVEGDFTAEVRVDGAFRPAAPGTSAVPGAIPGVQAGLVVMADDHPRAEFVSSGWANPTGLGRGVNLSVWPDERSNIGGWGETSDAPTYLRLRRGGNRFFASFSQDGVKWTEVRATDREVEMPARVKLGVIITTSSAPFKARFENFRLTGGDAVKPPPAVVAEKQAPPAAAEVARALEEIKATFKDAYDDLHTPKDAYTLSGKLLAEARRSKDKPARQYALFVEARDLAARGEDLPTGLEIIDETATVYAVNVREAKTAALLAAGKTFGNRAAAKAYLDAAIPLLEQARADDDYDRVAPLLPAVRQAYTDAQQPDLTKTASALVTQMEALQGEYKAVRPALTTLKEKPDDADANLAAGKYYALRKQDWDKGAPLLAKGSDAALSEAALKEAGPPATAEDRTAAGDALWKAGEKDAMFKTALRRRALLWYDKALPDLTDKEVEERVRNRVIELTKQFPDFATAWADLDVSKAEVVGNCYLRLKPGQTVSTKQPATGALSVKVVARGSKSKLNFEMFTSYKEPKDKEIKELLVGWDVKDKDLGVHWLLRQGLRPSMQGLGTSAPVGSEAWADYYCDLREANTNFGVKNRTFNNPNITLARKIVTN